VTKNKKLLAILLLFLAASLFMIFLRPAYATSVILASYETSDSASQTNNWEAESFHTPSNTTQISSAKYWIYNTGLTSYTAHLRTAGTNGKPTGSDLATNTTSYNMGSAYGWATFTFSYDLTGGGNYTILLNASNHYWQYDSSAGYANGVASYSSDGGSSWTEFSSEDFKFEVWGTEASSNNAPTVGEFQAPSGTAYENQYFFLNATVSDLDGATDFRNATVQINGTIQLNWVNATNVFSKPSDPNHYCTLDADNSVRTTVNSTAYRLCWKIELAWNYTVGSINVNATVYDTANATGTASQTGLFTFQFQAVLNLHTVDVDGNTLTGTTVYMSNGTNGVPSGLPPGTGYAVVGNNGWFTTITSNGWANYTGITNSTVYVYVKWYSLTVYSQTQLNLTGDTTTSLTCLCYPFTVSSVRFWAASDATVTAHSYASNILTLSFSSPLNNYTLISSCPVIPRYILNVTYDIATCFTTYLSLKHYANATLTLSYESWGDLYVQATDQTLISASIVSGQLLIVPNGTHGLISTLSVHCGSLGNPTSTAGFTAGTFGMAIYSGTYVLNGQTLTLGWATSPFTGGTGTTGTTGTSLSMNIVLTFPSSAGKGQVVNGTLTVTWNTYAMIYIWQVVCASPYSSWIVNVGALPLALQSAQAQGSASLNVTLTIPKDVADGNYQVPCSVTLQTPTGVAKTVGSTVNLTIGAAAQTININVTYLFFIVSIGMFLLLFVTMFVRRRSKARQF
jgi:hypothetical protein